MLKAPLLFDPAEFRPPPIPRRHLMHVFDAGPDDGEASHLVRFTCKRCGYETGWVRVESVTEGRRGKPCPTCNESITEAACDTTPRS
jgi:hypothetical protein